MATSSRRDLLYRAGPLVLAYAAEPLAGLTDTAVLAAVEDEVGLGGIGLGVVVSNLLGATVYVLRMSSAGLTAQALGASDVAESQRVLVRSLTVALVVGVAVVVLAPLIASLAFWMLDGAPLVEAAGSQYFMVRSLGRPADFVVLVTSGWLVAHGRSRAVLVLSLAFSGVNVALDLVLGPRFGLIGVASATAVASWAAGLLALRLIPQVVGATGGWSSDLRSGLWTVQALRRLARLNLDFMLRTWALVLGFAWFANAGARIDTTVLAANHILVQLISVAAFVLDAFAFVGEAEVGRAMGGGALDRLHKTVRSVFELSLLAGLGFSLSFWLIGPLVLRHLIQEQAVVFEVLAALPWCALCPLIGASAWVLDGVFVGAGQSRAMRDAAFVALVGYLGLDFGIRWFWPEGGNHGLWLAFLGYYVFRALTLAVRYPTVLRAVAKGQPLPRTSPST